MGDPVTIGLMAAGGTKVAGGLMQAKGIAEQGAAETAAARFNAQIAEIQGAQREGLIRRKARRQRGKMRTAIAKSGVTIEGSPMEALADSAAESEIDALNARFDAATTAKLERMRGETARKTARQKTTAQLLTTATDAAQVGMSLFGGGG